MAFARFGGNSNVVDAISVEIFDALDAGQLFEFSGGTDADDLILMLELSEIDTSLKSSLTQRGSGVPQ